MEKSQKEKEAKEDFINRILEMFLEFFYDKDKCEMSQGLIDLREKMLCRHNQEIEECEQKKNQIELHSDMVRKAIKIIS